MKIKRMAQWLMGTIVLVVLMCVATGSAYASTLTVHQYIEVQNPLNQAFKYGVGCRQLKSSACLKIGSGELKELDLDPVVFKYDDSNELLDAKKEFPTVALEGETPVAPGPGSLLDSEPVRLVA